MRLSIILIVALGTLSIANAQQSSMDITRIMSYFVVSQVAAEKCLNPTDNEKAKFMQNLLSVTFRTKQAIKERSPRKSDEVLAAEFDSFYSGVRKNFEEALENAGCNSAVGKQGISLWKVNVNWTSPL